MTPISRTRESDLLRIGEFLVGCAIFENLGDGLYRRLVVESVQITRVAGKHGIVLVAELLSDLEYVVVRDMVGNEGAYRFARESGVLLLGSGGRV